MQTRSPISTISYNTKDFLLNKLHELQRNYTISCWFCIRHNAEEDEKKDHWHVWMMPNKQVDTMKLAEEFIEPDECDPEHPLKTQPFRSSKIDHAILYYAHYKPYLLYIGQSRRFHYDWNMFYVSDADWFDTELQSALHFSKFAEKSRILDAVKNKNLCLSELITDGIVPLQMASQVYAYSNLLDNDRVIRGKRQTHSPKDTNGITVTPDGIVGGGGVLIEKTLNKENNNNDGKSDSNS